MLLRCDSDELKVSPEWATVMLAAIVNVMQASFLPQSMANVS